MQLIIILLATVSILTFLSGAIVFFGSRKKDRIRSLWFFLAAIFATFWVVAIAFFSGADNSILESLEWHIAWSFISAILLDVAFLGYTAWEQKNGKLLTIFFLIFGLAVSTAIWLNPNGFYTNVVLSNAGNSMEMVIGPVYFSYLAFFSTIVPVIIFMYLRQFFASKSNQRRHGDIITAVVYGVSSLVIMICDLILPLLGNWSVCWLGPLALAITIISIYYTILRYQMLSFSSIWLKIFSYVVIITSIALIYMIIFSVIFAALFRGSTPSIEVIVLNFIMIMIFLTLTPAINSLIGTIQRLSIKPDTKEKQKGSQA